MTELTGVPETMDVTTAERFATGAQLCPSSKPEDMFWYGKHVESGWYEVIVDPGRNEVAVPTVTGGATGQYAEP